MKALVCEMCGDNKLIKRDGCYVCESCGTRYSVEEAQKLMTDITVKIDNTDHLKKLYESARQALDAGNDATAEKLYATILQEDPSNWEPIFYTTFFEASHCRVMDMVSAISSIQGCLPSVIEKIHDSIDDHDDQYLAVGSVMLRVGKLCMSMFDAAVNVMNSSSNINKYQDDLNDLINRIVPVSITMFMLGDLIETYWGNDELYKVAISGCYSSGLNGLNRFNTTDANILSLKSKYVNKIIKYDPSFVNSQSYRKATSAPTSSGGCYVATCVYGSYDCPQVWTLRRYRDDTLAATWYGRAFIRTYYAISPTLVKWFGETKWFKSFWQGKLDRMVKRLNADGVENTPYQDRRW